MPVQAANGLFSAIPTSPSTSCGWGGGWRDGIILERYTAQNDIQSTPLQLYQLRGEALSWLTYDTIHDNIMTTGSWSSRESRLLVTRPMDAQTHKRQLDTAAPSASQARTRENGTDNASNPTGLTYDLERGVLHTTGNSWTALALRFGFQSLQVSFMGG